MKALTIWQPHANLTLYCGKDIENRPRKLNVRGPIAIHAGAKLDSGMYLPENFKKQIVRSAIIGVVDILDCVDSYNSQWFKGPFGYVLDNPRPLLKAIPCRGMLGFWGVPPEIEREIRRQLKGKIER